MAYSIHLEPRALAEIDLAFEYYSNNAKVLKKFNTELQKTYKIISQNPFFNKRYKKFRVLPLKKYPYIVIFTIDEQQKIIKIFALFNTKQDPSKLP